MIKSKVTKKDVLAVVAKLAEGMAPAEIGDVVVTEADVLDYVEKTITQIDNKNAKARERAAKAKAEGDALVKAIEAVLTEEPKTVAEILDEVGVEDATTAKIVARVGKLVRDGFAERTEVKAADGRKLKAYSLIAE